MVDEPVDYPSAIEPEDVVVMDALQQPHPQEGSTLDSLTMHVPAEIPSQPHLVPVETFVHSTSTDAEALPIAEEPHSLTETHMHSSDQAPVASNGIPEPELVETTAISDEVVLSEPLFVDESSTHPAGSVLEAEHVSSAAHDPAASSYVEGDSSETTVFTEQTQVEEPVQTETLQPVPEQVTESVEASNGATAEEFVSTDSSQVIGPTEAGAEDQQTETQEEHDPHEVSEGVYIDPPPAVFLSFAFLEHPEVCLFNQPSSTTEPSSYAILLSDQPTLYYEPLSTVFDALRNDSELSGVADLSHVELVLDAYDLQLTISEDNIFARETSLHDLNVLHDGSDFSGPLRLRLQLVNPRFIVRYRMLQDQIQRLNLAEVGEEYNVDELNDGFTQETTEQEHGPDYTEETLEQYNQEQGDETADSHLQIEEHTENASSEAQADPTSEGRC
ncbi:hypothetical protein BT96DRAFT_175475 [Gymnopus androsaceus JB14]|uniref:Uncharacterized protein n=1 Tax=Gymnopus androsaceus JB14 TaxID=1447944 RepID=A0A6A4IAP2_9AGAR|nr:hypothetical protein BT96DRAFT_175475 [Gymnopus androsaceus JB14]